MINIKLAKKLSSLIVVMGLFTPLPSSAFQENSEKTAVEKILKVPSRAETIKKVEQSLNKYKTMTASFIQRSPDGDIVEGNLFMERPGKVRFQYQEDVPILLVSNGSMISFIDYELKEVTRWPISKTPLGLLVDDKIVLDEEKLEIPEIKRVAGLIKITIIDPKRKDYGHITLIFEESNMEIRAWEVTDAQGYLTRVALLNIQYDLPIEDKQFKFKDPRPNKGRRPGRRH